MEKTIELVLTSGEGVDKVTIPTALWRKFEKRATELGIPTEELFTIALDIFLKKQGY